MCDGLLVDVLNRWLGCFQQRQVGIARVVESKRSRLIACFQ
jgi:hypothetical protein